VCDCSCSASRRRDKRRRITKMESRMESEKREYVVVYR
jgi:hypothetical protein